MFRSGGVRNANIDTRTLIVPAGMCCILQKETVPPSWFKATRLHMSLYRLSGCIARNTHTACRLASDTAVWPVTRFGARHQGLHRIFIYPEPMTYVSLQDPGPCILELFRPSQLHLVWSICWPCRMMSALQRGQQSAADGRSQAKL